MESWNKSKGFDVGKVKEFSDLESARNAFAL